MTLARKAAFAAGLLKGLVRPFHASYAVFFLTDLCNAQCSFCFNTRLSHLKSGHIPADKSGRLLSVEEYEKIAERISPLFQTVFGGGEPFLREEIDEIARVFYEKAGARLFSIPTNGFLVDKIVAKLERMLPACPNATFNLEVSLDAAREKHDQSRGLAGSFERALSVCRAVFGLQKKYGNINLVVNTAVTEANLSQFGELQSVLGRELHAGRWHHNIQYDQRLERVSWQHPRVDPNNTAETSLMERLISRWYVRFINDLIAEQLAQNKMLYRCNAGRKLFVMMPDGEISPCEPFVFEKVYQKLPRFDIRKYDYDFRAVQRDREFRKIVDFISQRACNACPWTCAAITSMTYSPWNWPLFSRFAARG